MKSKRGIIILVIILAIIAAYFLLFYSQKATGLNIPSLRSFLPAEKLPEIEEPEDLYYCEEDSDCISVGAGCCDCSNFGEAKAINTKYKDLWDDILLGRCGIVACPTAMSIHWTCVSSEIRCRDNSCMLVEQNIER